MHKRLDRRVIQRWNPVLMVERRHIPGFDSCRRYFTIQTASSRTIKPPILASRVVISVPQRQLGLIPTVVRSVLKIRYLLLGGAIGGGASLAKQFEEWKKNLPSTEWMNSLIPDIQLENVRSSLVQLGQSIKGKADEVDMDPILGRIASYRQWFEQRLESAIQAADASKKAVKSEKQQRTEDAINSEGLLDAIGSNIPVSTISAMSLSDLKRSGGDLQERLTEETKKLQLERDKSAKLQSKLDATQTELMQLQIRYQKEIEKLERQNQELRKQLLLKRGQSAADLQLRKIKKSLIDMYSEVLDELSGYDNSYSIADNLPRVVVVGDQSSGKTSVLEMVAQARIFPRGAGEMMTRAPVKVTLSEGPYHVAMFKDSQREYNLANETDLAELRREIELRMRKSVAKGKTVSNEVISMTVKGPGLQRMVLVDLPGIISTVTKDMDPETRNHIRSLAQHYMANPNSIILCIQDGSVDAERSNVTDLVSSMDPNGKRTIFVLTKVDVAEQNLANPDRVAKILNGKLFPMKALGYFAVVTGRGNQNDTIQEIKDYEEKFFASSKIFKAGLVNSSKITTRNLSFAVSECFWKMVRETVEQQADAFKATRFNLETEWKNTFPRIRELDRDELFEKARGEILDEVVNLSLVSPQTWETAISRKLLDKVATYVFENIYLSAAHTSEADGCTKPISAYNRTGTFNTTVDIKLKQWTESGLGEKCVEVGWETLKDQFFGLIDRAKKSKDRDDIFDSLKAEVVKEALNRHVWEDKAPEVLRVIQLNALEDRSITDKSHWESALNFLGSFLREKLDCCEKQLHEKVGPGMMESWLYWRSRTQEQAGRAAIQSELERILAAELDHTAKLSMDEVTTVKRNLQTSGLDVTSDMIRETWHLLYRVHFLKRELTRCSDCRRGFHFYKQGIESDIDYNGVVLFWRIQQMLKVTSNALRQQIMNREARRLEREIKDVLEEYSQDADKKQSLLTGRRVQLAEELKKVRQIQELLEEFIQALNSERDQVQ